VRFASWRSLAAAFLAARAADALKRRAAGVADQFGTGRKQRSFDQHRRKGGEVSAFVVRGRDFTPDGEIGAVEITDGDRCPKCGAPLRIARGIELGHVFQLGRKYAEVFGLTALGPDGKPVTVTMGSYGVGITRAVAALAEQTFDESGLCWPRSVAPADVHLVATGKDQAVFAACESLAADLESARVRVLFDDRFGVSPGVKFKDSELIGVPTIVVVGKGLANGVVEIKDRRSGLRREVAVAEAAAEIRAEIAG
jgi:prolyl-tRNA synthetase